MVASYNQAKKQNCSVLNNVEDHKLLGRIYLQRDENALEVLLQRHRRIGFKIAFNICHNASMAEEILQEVALTIWKGKFSFKFTKNEMVGYWFYSVVKKQAQFHIRSEINYRSRNYKYFNAAKNIDRFFHRFQSFDWVNDTDCHDLEMVNAQLKSAVSGLHENYRIPITLFFLQDWPIGKICSKLNARRYDIQKRIKKGLILLRKMMLS